MFFFNDTATTEIYTLSLHDALPIYAGAQDLQLARAPQYSSSRCSIDEREGRLSADRKAPRVRRRGAMDHGRSDGDDGEVVVVDGRVLGRTQNRLQLAWLERFRGTSLGSPDAAPELV